MLNILASTSISLIVVVAYTYVAKYESKIYFKNQDSAYFNEPANSWKNLTKWLSKKYLCNWCGSSSTNINLPNFHHSGLLMKMFRGVTLRVYMCFSLSLSLSSSPPLSYWRKNCQCKMIKIDNFSKMISMITRYFYFVGLFNFEILI